MPATIIGTSMRRSAAATRPDPAEVVGVHGVGQRHVGPGIETAHELVGVVVQVALHGISLVPAVGRRQGLSRQRRLACLLVATEADRQLGLGAVGQVGDAPGDAEADVRRGAVLEVVPAAPIRIGHDRLNLGGLGADLIGRREGTVAPTHAASTRSANIAHHSRARIPPMDPPATRAKRSIPR